MTQNQNTTGVETPQTPAQTQTPGVKMVKITINKEVKQTKTIKVPKKIYNTIRSFVESSPREEYDWNVGYDIGDKVVFEKQGKWILEVKKEVMVKEGGGEVAVAELTTDTTPRIVVAGHFVSYEKPFMGIVKVNVETAMESVDDFDQIVPEEEVPFARRILGYEIKRKFEEYLQVDYYI